MSSSGLPIEWARLAEKAGIRQSMGGIAEAIGKPTSTVSRMIGGKSIPTAETVGAVALVLRVSDQRIWDLLGRGGKPGLGRWSPPESVHDFDSPARDALSKLIRVMAEGAQGVADRNQKSDGRGDGGEGNQSTGPKTPPAAPPTPISLDDLRETKAGDSGHLRRAARRRSGTKRPDPHDGSGEENQDRSDT